MIRDRPVAPRFGTRRDQANLLDRRKGVDDRLGQLDLDGSRRAEAGAAPRGVAQPLNDVGMRVTGDQRSPRADQIDVLVAVGVPHERTATAHQEEWFTTDRAPRAHRAVHSCRNDACRTREKLSRCVVQIVTKNRELQSDRATIAQSPSRAHRADFFSPEDSTGSSLRRVFVLKVSSSEPRNAASHHSV
jgi:hypothetical protein